MPRLRSALRLRPGPAPGPPPRAGAPRHPAHAGAPGRARGVSGPRGDHSLPGLGLLRPPGPNATGGPHPGLRGPDGWGRADRAAERPAPTRRRELARHDDFRGGLRQRLVVEGPLPRHRLRSVPGPDQVRDPAPRRPRRHPARPRLGGAKPQALRHPRGQRELRWRLPGVVPDGWAVAGGGTGHPGGDSGLGCGRQPWPGARSPRAPTRLCALRAHRGGTRRQEPADLRRLRHVPLQLRPDCGRLAEAGGDRSRRFGWLPPSFLARPPPLRRNCWRGWPGPETEIFGRRLPPTRAWIPASMRLWAWRLRSCGSWSA